MVKVWFDTLRLSQRLRDAGWSGDQADAITEAIHDPLDIDPSTISLNTLKVAKVFQMMGATTWEQATASARAVADAYAGR